MVALLMDRVSMIFTVVLFDLLLAAHKEKYGKLYTTDKREKMAVME